MAIVDNDFANISDGAGPNQTVSSVIAGVPGSFEVDQDLNICGVCGARDGLRVFVGNGQRFFHHYRDCIVRAKFYYFAVVVGGGVDEDSLRFGGAKSFVEIGVIERQVEMEFCRVLIEESAVGFGDGYDLDVGAISGMGEEAFSMAVDQAGDDDAERRFAVVGG